MVQSPDFVWNFPETKWEVGTDDLTRRGQADHIVQEAAEVFSAAEYESDEDYILELLDCIHACETALREFDKERIDKARQLVIEKNFARGYYNLPRLSWHENDPLPKDSSDIVDHPTHYTEGTVETVDVIEAVIDGLDPLSAVRLGHIIRYTRRAGLKGDPKIDLAKANNYAHRLVTGHWRWENDSQ